MICDKIRERSVRYCLEWPVAGRWLRRWRHAIALSGTLGLVGCSETQTPAPESVYFDTASGQAVMFAAGSEYPAVHPETGQPTLLPTMHCPKCNAWRPVPPPEQLNRSAALAVCPKCRGRLQIEGPIPSP